jgi:hypothetical protein
MPRRRDVSRAGVFALAFVALLAACDPASVAPRSDDSAETSGGDVPGDVLSGEETPTYVGTWAADLASCSVPQEQEGAPYIVVIDGFDQHEAHCRFTNVDALAEDDWRAGGECTVDGDSYNTALDLRIENGALRIADGPPLQRCP